MELTLQTTLATILTQLANFFGTTSDIIMQNAPYWLTKYGWFMMMQNMVGAFMAAIFTTGAILAIIYLALELKPKHSIRMMLIIFIISLIIWCGMCYSQCAIAPEIYGLNSLIEQIKS